MCLGVELFDFTVNDGKSFKFSVPIGPVESFVSACPDVSCQCMNRFHNAMDSICSIVPMDDSVWVVVRSKVAGSKLIPSRGEIATKHIDPSNFRLVSQGAIDDIDIFAGILFVAKERVQSMGKAWNLVRMCQPLVEYIAKDKGKSIHIAFSGGCLHCRDGLHSRYVAVTL